MASASSSSSDPWGTGFTPIPITATMTMGQSGISESFTFQGDPSWTQTSSSAVPTTTLSRTLSTTLTPFATFSSSWSSSLFSSSFSASASPSPTTTTIVPSLHGQSHRALLIAVPTAIATAALIVCGVLLWRRYHPSTFYRFLDPCSYCFSMQSLRLLRWPSVRKKQKTNNGEDDSNEDLVALRSVPSFRGDKKNKTKKKHNPFSDPFLDSYTGAGELDTFTRRLRQYEEEAARAHEKFGFTVPPSTPLSDRIAREKSATTSSKSNGSASPRPWYMPKLPGTGTGSGGLGSPLSKKPKPKPAYRSYPTTTTTTTPRTPTRRGQSNNSNDNGTNNTNNGNDSGNGNGNGNNSSNDNNNNDDNYSKFGQYSSRFNDDTISLESWEERWFAMGSDTQTRKHIQAQGYPKDKQEEGEEEDDNDANSATPSSTTLSPTITRPRRAHVAGTQESHYPRGHYKYGSQHKHKHQPERERERYHERDWRRQNTGAHNDNAVGAGGGSDTGTGERTGTGTGTGTGTRTDTDPDTDPIDPITGPGQSWRKLI